jgi:hypothetical protein
MKLDKKWVGAALVPIAIAMHHEEANAQWCPVTASLPEGFTGCVLSANYGGGYLGLETAIAWGDDHAENVVGSAGYAIGQTAYGGWGYTSCSLSYIQLSCFTQEVVWPEETYGLSAYVEIFMGCLRSTGYFYVAGAGYQQGWDTGAICGSN